MHSVFDAGMPGYPQVLIDPHLSVRRQEFAALDSWVPVAMETIVEEDSCETEVDSFRARERAYTFSGMTADGDVRSHMYESLPSYRQIAQPSASKKIFEDSSQEPAGEDEEPRWVCFHCCSRSQQLLPC
jgi:hypothetical protein